jgi:hypothetical protein
VQLVEGGHPRHQSARTGKEGKKYIFQMKNVIFAPTNFKLLS